MKNGIFSCMNYTEIIANLELENTQLKNSILQLTEQLAWLKRQVFGKRSEKIIPSSPTQLQFDNFNISEAEEAQKTKTIEEHERKKPNRNGQDKLTLPDDLPIERVVLDLAEEEKVCQETGVPFVKIGEEVSSKLAHKPGSYYIKQFIRPKYANPLKSEDGIKVVDLPESLLTRCQADDSFLADLLVKKYADHLPLYRISEILGRENIFISRQLLSQWVLRSASALKPLYDEMRLQVLASGNVFIDESPVKMLDPGAGQTKLTYMWVLCGGNSNDPPYRVYNFRENRQHQNADAILKGFKGVVHSDKYGAYETMAHKKLFTWCPCWAHIRRKFFEAQHGDPEFREMVLDKIRELFELEKVCWTLSPDERIKMRQKDAVPIIDELSLAIKDKLTTGKVLAKSNFKEALGYYLSLIPYLKNYTEHAWARLDNNVCERAVRPLAIGRKNWLFLGNHDGGEAAAISLSLIQTCRALKINPRIYLESVMRQIMSYPANRLADLLPDNWLKAQNL
jgi:transposase